MSDQEQENAAQKIVLDMRIAPQDTVRLGYPLGRHPYVLIETPIDQQEDDVLTISVQLGGFPQSDEGINLAKDVIEAVNEALQGGDRSEPQMVDPPT